MTVAATGQVAQKGIDWRKELRAAIADNPFVKGEGLSPKARRELLVTRNACWRCRAQSN